MKTSLHYTLALAAVLAASQSASLRAQETTTPKDAPMGRVETMKATMSAEVTAIDQTTREITLKGPEGNEQSFTVGDAVKRLDEVKVGDVVRLDYVVSVAAEVRKPTAAEAAHPLVIMDAAGRADTNSIPAAGVARRFKVVTTIEALDRRNETVTVKGPMGRYLTVRAADPERLTKVRIGETVVIVYTEAAVLSLEKVDKKAGE